MKLISFTKIILCGILVLTSAQINAQQIIKQTETHSVFKGLFYSVWSRLRALNPHQRQKAKVNITYTAGIRGAEATETLIKPYWKDDLSNNKAFQTELEQYSKAQKTMDNGDLKASVKAFDQFINQYSKSNLLANALLGKGVSQAGLGDNSAAKITLQQFIDSFPRHSMTAEVQQILTQIN